MEKNIKILLFIILVLILALAATIYSQRRAVQAHRATISALDSISTTFDQYRLKTGETVSAQSAIILSYQGALDAGYVEIDRLKALNIKTLDANIRLTERIAILEREAEYDKPPVIIYVDSSDTTNKYIQIPFGFGYQDKWSNLHAVVDEVPVFDTIELWSYPEITIGWQRQGFLKKKERKVLYTNENPYITITSMQNVLIEEPKKWYQTDVAKVSGGIIIFEVARMLLTK